MGSFDHGRIRMKTDTETELMAAKRHRNFEGFGEVFMAPRGARLGLEEIL